MQVLYPTTSTDYAYNITSGNAASDQNASIYGTVPSASTTVDLNCKDGKDDGKIGFGEALWSGIKGAAKTVVNTVKGILTDPKKLLLTAGAVALSVVCPPVGVALCAVGAVSGAVQIGQGFQKANLAETDEQARMAFEDIGGGVLTVGVSVAGARTGLKAMKGVEGSAMSTATGLKGTAKAYGTDLVSSIKGGAGYETTSLAARLGNTKIGQNIKDADFSKGNRVSSTKEVAQKTYGEYKETIKTEFAERAASKEAISAAKENVKVADELMANATNRAETDIAAGFIKEADAALAMAEAGAKPSFLQSTGIKAGQINSAIKTSDLGYFGAVTPGMVINSEQVNSDQQWLAAGKPAEAYSPYYNIDFDFDTASIVSDMNKLQMQQSMINASV